MSAETRAALEAALATIAKCPAKALHAGETRVLEGAARAHLASERSEAVAAQERVLTECWPHLAWLQKALAGKGDVHVDAIVKAFGPEGAE